MASAQLNAMELHWCAAAEDMAWSAESLAGMRYLLFHIEISQCTVCPGRLCLFEAMAHEKINLHSPKHTHGPPASGPAQISALFIELSFEKKNK